MDQKKSCIKFYISFLIRIEGRVQCFTFVKDEGFELDEQRETFVEDNKVRLLFLACKDFDFCNLPFLCRTFIFFFLLTFKFMLTVPLDHGEKAGALSFIR